MKGRFLFFLSLLVAVKAEFLFRSGVKPEQGAGVGTVRLMAASAVKRLARSCGVLRPHTAGGNSRGKMRPVRNVAVAHEAYLDGLVHEQRHLVRRVGAMAGQAVAGSNGRMDGLF